MWNCVVTNQSTCYTLLDWSVGEKIHACFSSFRHISLSNNVPRTYWLNKHFYIFFRKLGRAPADIELEAHFGHFGIDAGCIFKCWILFMAKTWSLVKLWASREPIEYYETTLSEKKS